LNASKDHRISRLGALKALGVPKTRTTLDHLSDVIDDLKAERKLEKIKGHSICLPRRPNSIRRGVSTEFLSNFLGALERAETQQLSRTGALKAMGLPKTRKNLDRLAQTIDALHLQGSVQKLGGHSVSLLAGDKKRKPDEDKIDTTVTKKEKHPEDKHDENMPAVPPPVAIPTIKNPRLNVLRLISQNGTNENVFYTVTEFMTLNRPGLRLHELKRYDPSVPLVWVDSFNPGELTLRIIQNDSDEQWLYKLPKQGEKDDLKSRIFEIINLAIDELKKEKTKKKTINDQIWKDYKEELEKHIETTDETWPHYMMTETAKLQNIRSIFKRMGQLQRNIESLEKIEFVKLTFPNSKQFLSLPAYTIVNVPALGGLDNDARLFYQPATDQNDESSKNQLQGNWLKHVNPFEPNKPNDNLLATPPTTYHELRQEKRVPIQDANNSLTIKLPLLDQLKELVFDQVDSNLGEPAKTSEQDLDGVHNNIRWIHTAENKHVYYCSVHSNSEGKKVIHIESKGMVNIGPEEKNVMHINRAEQNPDSEKPAAI